VISQLIIIVVHGERPEAGWQLSPVNIG